MEAFVIRRMAGWSQAKVAAEAGTSTSTVRIYEIDPTGVVDYVKRRALRLVYTRLQTEVLTRAS